jgi:hypothetical protein
VKEDNKQLAELDQKCKLLKEEMMLKRYTHFNSSHTHLR